MIMIVELQRKNSEYPDLSLNKPYFIIGIEADDYRLLNNDGKPYLYPSVLFKVINPEEPTDWISEYGEDGERYAYPAVLNSTGFFEDFFEHNPEATRLFWQEVNQRLAIAA